MPIEFVPGRIQFRAEKMLKVGLFDTPRMFCDVYCLEPGQEQAPHVHEGADKVYYVIDGEGEFTLGSDQHRLGPGNVVLAPSLETHGVRNPGPERLTLLVFMAPNPNH
jgi:mannose-6-phosphate isomerase-like protein (cupin superfamily)